MPGGRGYGVERVPVKFNMVPPENQQIEKEIPAFKNIMFKLHVIFWAVWPFIILVGSEGWL